MSDKLEFEFNFVLQKSILYKPIYEFSCKLG